MSRSFAWLGLALLASCTVTSYAPGVLLCDAENLCPAGLACVCSSCQLPDAGCAVTGSSASGGSSGGTKSSGNTGSSGATSSGSATGGTTSSGTSGTSSGSSTATGSTSSGTSGTSGGTSSSSSGTASGNSSGASTSGGTGSTGGTSGGSSGGSSGQPVDAGTCFLAGSYFAAGGLNPGNPCQVCDPTQPEVWSSFPDGGNPDGGCGAGNVCAQGICACPSGYLSCVLLDGGSVVTDTCTDDANCGACGNSCTGSEGCFGGSCTHPSQQWTARGNLGAVAADDGLLYAIGGYVATTGESTAAVEAYDPRSNSWFEQQAMSTARAELQVTRDGDGGIYAIGGIVYDGGYSFPISVERFDLSTGSWSAAPALPDSVFGGGAGFGSDGNVYLVGGDVNYVVGGQTLELQGSSWPIVANRKVASAYIAVSTGPAGVLAACGGNIGNYTATGDCELFDPVPQIWTSLSPLPTPRCYAVAASRSDGTLVVAGGDNCAATSVITGVVELYHSVPDGGAWLTSADGGAIPMPLPVSAAAAVRGPDDRIYVFGGFDTNYEPYIQVFNRTSRWEH